MKRIVVVIVVIQVAAALAGCQRDRVSKPAAGGKRHAIKPPPVEAGGRFFARDPAGGEHELKLHKLAVDVTTQPGTVRSHLSMEVATPTDGQSEAVIRLPVPRGAAVTDAVLWVNDKPMRGAFVERQRANSIYTSIVTRRRDPALVAWDGPGWIAVSIYPLENNRPRRFELEWVEPAAEADGRVQYRVPIVADGDRLVGRASVKVDGRKMAGNASDLIAIAPADPHKVVTRRVPGDPFQQVMLREPVPTGAPHFVLVVETSAALTIADRARQRAMLDALLEDLPPEAKVTMLAADWDVSLVVEDAGAASWPEALAKIDAIPSAGGLHIERALREAAERARKTGAGAVLFVGIAQDGFPGDGVAAPLAMFRNAGVRLSVVEVGTGEVPRPLAGAVAETGGEAITVQTFDESLPFLPDALRPRPGHPALDARGEGEWHVLRTVTGDAVWIGRGLDMEIPADAETARAEEGSPLAIDLASLWDRARLEWRDRDADAEVAKVVTPATSLLVLETEQDYRRFGLDVPQRVAMAQGASGRRHKGEEGKMGKATYGNREGLYGLKGPKDNPDPRLAQEMARNAGSLGLLKQSEGSHIASIFGRDTALGQDQSDVLGGLIGNQSGATSGVGGLGLVGTGVRRRRHRRRHRGPRQPRHDRQGRRRQQQRVRLRPRRRRPRRPARAGARRRPRCRERPRFARQGDHPPHHPAPRQRGPVLLRAGANEEAGPRRAHHGAIHHRGVGPGHRVGAAKLDDRQRARRELHRAGGSPLAVSAAGRRRDRHRVVAVRSHAPRRRGDGGTSPPVETPVRPIDEALATLAKGAGSEQVERIASLLGLRRLASAEMLAWTIDRRTGGVRDAPAGGEAARAREPPPRRGARAVGIGGRRAGRRRRRATRHRRRRRRGRGAQARDAPLTW